MHEQPEPAETATDVAGRIDPALAGELRLHVMKRAAAPDDGAWNVAYLALVARLLEGQGLDEALVAPLRGIAEDLGRRAQAPAPPADADWSEDYAAACAEIAYSILVGEEEDEAAQKVARNLVARGVPLPSRGGDARGWKRLLEFRDRLRNGIVGEPLQALYRQELARLKQRRD